LIYIICNLQVKSAYRAERPPPREEIQIKRHFIGRCCGLQLLQAKMAKKGSGSGYAPALPRKGVRALFKAMGSQKWQKMGSVRFFGMPCSNWKKMDDVDKEALLETAEDHLANLSQL
jgi:hypothetical protein